MAAVTIIETVLGGAESRAGLESMVLASESAVAATDDPHAEATVEVGVVAKALAKAEAVAVGYWKGVGIADRWTARALGQQVEWIGWQDRVQAARSSQDRRQWVDQKAQCGILIGAAGLLWRTAFGSLLLLEVFLLS